MSRSVTFEIKTPLEKFELFFGSRRIAEHLKMELCVPAIFTGADIEPLGKDLAHLIGPFYFSIIQHVADEVQMAMDSYEELDRDAHLQLNHDYEIIIEYRD